MQLKEVMTRDVKMVRPESTLVDAARQMRDFDVGPIPVCDDDNEILGMVTDRDIATRAIAEGRDPSHTLVRDVMTSDVLYCFEDEDVSEAARLMQQRQVRRLLVLNRKWEVAGIISLGDLAVETQDNRLAGETLEQVSNGDARGSVRLRRSPGESAVSRNSIDVRRAAIFARSMAPGGRSHDTDRGDKSSVTRTRDFTGRKTIAGLFPDGSSAECAVDDLKQAGFSRDQIGMVIRDGVERQGAKHHKKTHAADGALAGALIGALFGGVAAYLIAIGVWTIPGLGPVLAGGVLADALGIVAATAAIGAGIGAAAGGFVGVLIGMGIRAENARQFERGVDADEALVTVKAGDRILEALAILERNDGNTGYGRVARNTLKN